MTDEIQSLSEEERPEGLLAYLDAADTTAGRLTEHRLKRCMNVELPRYGRPGMALPPTRAPDQGQADHDPE